MPQKLASSADDCDDGDAFFLPRFARVFAVAFFVVAALFVDSLLFSGLLLLFSAEVRLAFDVFLRGPKITLAMFTQPFSSLFGSVSTVFTVFPAAKDQLQPTTINFMLALHCPSCVRQVGRTAI